MKLVGLTKPLGAAAVGSVIALSLQHPAFASDHNSKLINWNGLYAGAVLGLVRGNSTSSCASNAPGLTADNFFDWLQTADNDYTSSLAQCRSLDLPAVEFRGQTRRTAELDATGVAGGVQVGYNVDIQKIVLGIEADFMFSNLAADDIFAGKTASTGMDWMSTIRGRVGYKATENMLVFGTGGVAFANWHDRYFGELFPGDSESAGFAVDNDHVRTGYTVGGGIELATATGPRFKVEYLFADFGSESTTTSFGSVIKFDHQVQTIRLGVNFPLQ